MHRRLGTRGTWWEPPGLTDDVISACLAEVEEALALWRGTPYVDLEEAPSAVAERARLEELRSVALEDRAVLRLALGDHGTVAAELESLTAAYPLRERLWGLRAVALARAGRQADALDALREVRDVLDRELGLEPSAQLRDLQTAVLRQDPALSRGAAVAAPAAPLPTAPPAAPRLPDWPLVGRDDQLAVLVDALAAAEQGAPRFAALTGEPGIGKSRLCGELAARAVANGARVVVGRCSQDDGAPPLWPWRQVLRGLGAELAVPDADDEGAEFRTWEAITDRVAEAARRRDRRRGARRPALGRPVQPPGAAPAGRHRGRRSPADPRHLAHRIRSPPAPSPTRRSPWPGGMRPGWTCTASPRPRPPRWSRPSRR